MEPTMMTLDEKIDRAVSFAMEHRNSDMEPFCALFADLFGEDALFNATKDGIGGHEFCQMLDAMRRLARKDEVTAWLTN